MKTLVAAILALTLAASSTLAAPPTQAEQQELYNCILDANVAYLVNETGVSRDDVITYLIENRDTVTVSDLFDDVYSTMVLLFELREDGVSYERLRYDYIEYTSYANDPLSLSLDVLDCAASIYGQEL